MSLGEYAKEVWGRTDEKIQELIFFVKYTKLVFLRALQPEESNHIGSIRGGHIVEGEAVLGGEVEALLRHLQVLVDLVGGQQGRDARPVGSTYSNKYVIYFLLFRNEKTMTTEEHIL